MPREDEALLLDMLESARDAVEFAEGLDYADFVEDRRSQLAILKAVEIVGEAASRVSADTRGAHPAWREITGMRNRLVHAYFGIDLRQVWDTVRDDIPSLINELEPLVPQGPARTVFSSARPASCTLAIESTT